jgi:hypothetical protein
MAFSNLNTQDCPNQVTLYQDANIQIGKFANEEPHLYLIQEEFDTTDVVELDLAGQHALYLILKNRFEA